MRNLTKLAPDLSRTWKMDVRAIGDHLLINDASGWWACPRADLTDLDDYDFDRYEDFLQATEPCDDPATLQRLARQLGAPVGCGEGAPVYQP